MINLSTKGRYATRILVNLARSPQGEAKSARIIAEEEGLSMDYVEQLLIKLKAAGFVKSRRGKNGGTMLARSADDISVDELIAVVEGEIALAPCITEACERKRNCPTHLLWKEANDALKRVFKSSTIAELAKNAQDDAHSFQI